MRLGLLVPAALLGAIGCADSVATGPWAPSRPVEFIVAAGPGGGSDQLARTVQSIVQKYGLIDAPVIVTNKGGGAGSEEIGRASCRERGEMSGGARSGKKRRTTGN